MWKPNAAFHPLRCLYSVRKVESLTDFRKDAPEQEKIREFVNRAYGSACLANTRSVIIVEVINGGTVRTGFIAGDADRAELLLALKHIELALITGASE